MPQGGTHRRNSHNYEGVDHRLAPDDGWRPEDLAVLSRRLQVDFGLPVLLLFMVDPTVIPFDELKQLVIQTDFGLLWSGQMVG